MENKPKSSKELGSYMKAIVTTVIDCGGAPESALYLPFMTAKILDLEQFQIILNHLINKGLLTNKHNFVEATPKAIDLVARSKEPKTNIVRAYGGEEC